MYRAVLTDIMRPAAFSTWASIMQYNIENTANNLPLAAINFGVQFNLAAVDQAAVIPMKQRCRKYLYEFLKQLRDRIPTNVQQLESLSVIAVCSTGNTHAGSVTAFFSANV